MTKLTDCNVTGFNFFENIIVKILFIAVYVKNQIFVIFHAHELIDGRPSCDLV